MDQTVTGSTSDIPPEAYQLGAAPLSIHRATNLPGVGIIIVFVLIGLLFAGLGVQAAISEEPIGVLIMGGIGLFFFWIAAGNLLQRVRDRDLLVVAMPEGFAVARGGAATIYRWSEIESVWQSVIVMRRRTVTSTTYRYTAQRRDGTKIALTGVLSDIAMLGQTIQENVTHLLLPVAVEAFQAGREVPFDALTLSRKGITKGKNFLPWEQVHEVRISNGRVMIWQEGGHGTWAQMPVDRIANLYIFSNLVNQIVGIT